MVVFQGGGNGHQNHRALLENVEKALERMVEKWSTSELWVAFVMVVCRLVGGFGRHAMN